MKQIVTYFSAIILTSMAYGQSELAVNCYNSDTPFNSYAIDNVVIEYGLCGLQPSFYVGVIDPSNCMAWGTNHNGANPTHAFGNLNEGSCRQRVEYFFVFDTGDSLQLAGMVNMLQNIPSGHSIVIYTPISYNYSSVNTVNPNLIQELESRWNPSIIQGNDIMILYGEQGNAASYVEETTQNGGQVSFSKTICNTNLSINKQEIKNKLFVQQNGTTFTLNPDLKIENLQIADASGRVIPFVRDDQTIQLSEGIHAGVYLFSAEGGGKTYRSKQLISF